MAADKLMNIVMNANTSKTVNVQGRKKQINRTVLFPDDATQGTQPDGKIRVLASFVDKNAMNNFVMNLKDVKVLFCQYGWLILVPWNCYKT